MASLVGYILDEVAMRFRPLRPIPLLGLAGLTIFGCGGGSKATPPAATEAVTADKILGRPAEWSDTRKKSDALYQAGKYAEHIAVLEALAKAHPKFADVEIQLGDTWKSDHDELGPLPERLAKSAAHFRRALEAADASGDDFGREMATDSLLGVYLRQIHNSASLSVDRQRQLIADAGSFADHILKTHPAKPANAPDPRPYEAHENAREIKSKLVQLEARLKK